MAMDIGDQLSRVDGFAELMKKRLTEHKDVTPWPQCSVEYLLERLEANLASFRASILNREGRTLDEVRADAADVANFAMMILDNLES